jgi:hypothetical protein
MDTSVGQRASKPATSATNATPTTMAITATGRKRMRKDTPQAKQHDCRTSSPPWMVRAFKRKGQASATVSMRGLATIDAEVRKPLPNDVSGSTTPLQYFRSWARKDHVGIVMGGSLVPLLAALWVHFG